MGLKFVSHSRSFRSRIIYIYNLLISDYNDPINNDKKKLKKKRNLKKQWDYYRSPITKIKLNKAIKYLKKLLSEKKMQA